MISLFFCSTFMKASSSTPCQIASLNVDGHACLVRTRMPKVINASMKYSFASVSFI